MNDAFEKIAYNRKNVTLTVTLAEAAIMVECLEAGPFAAVMNDMPESMRGDVAGGGPRLAAMILGIALPIAHDAMTETETKES